MSKSQSHKPLEIKISTVVAVSAMLNELDLLALNMSLRDMTGGASDYFDNEFTVIDFANVSMEERVIDWPAMLALFKSYNLNPVAVRNVPASMEPAVKAYGLSIDIVAAPRPSPLDEQPVTSRQVEAPPSPASPAPAPAQASREAMIVDLPVRAGQRIYAQGSDLIVTAAVNNGAEIIADGSIHVYAPLRGRALAGASGNSSARIFTMSMEAELVSIAGMYRTFENGLPEQIARRAAQVRLDGDRLDMSALSASARG